MTNKELVIIMLEGLMAGIEMDSEIPIQWSELNTIKLLLLADNNENK